MVLRPVLLAAFLVPAAAAPGCARVRAAGPVEITYWTGWSGHEYDIQQDLIREFNRTHPGVRVRMLTQFSSTGSYQKVRIAFAGGATPDVLSTIWDRELAGYAMRGVLEPLDAYMAGAGRSLERDFTPGVARMLRVDGRVYGLMVTTNTNLIVFNKGLFRTAGLDPERPPKTIDELDRAAQRCTQYDRTGRLIHYGFRPIDLSLWAYVFGGNWYDSSSRRITANDPGNIAALRWMAGYARMFDLRKIQAFRATFGDNQSANGPFFIGKMAMWQTGEWSAEFIRRYAPRLDWGWFALPTPPGGRPFTTKASGSIFVIPRASRHKREAWQFLNWITSPRAVGDFCAAIKNVPPLLEAGNRPEFLADPFFRFAIRVSEGPNSFGPPPIPIWGTYQREIERAEDSAVMGGQDPGWVLDSLQRRMAAELRETMAELRPGFREDGHPSHE